MSGPTLVVTGGRIWTGLRWVDHLVVDGGRIVAAGPGPAPGRSVPTGAERLVLPGRLVTPALVDAHLHLSALAYRRGGVDLAGSRSWEEVAERVAGWRRLHPGGPVFGGGWDETGYPEARYLSGAELDRLAPDVPMVLSRICEHVALANRAAREAMGIDRNCPDPPGGSFDRDRDGEPTGVLREAALGALARFPFPSLRDAPALGERVLAEAAGRGLAAVASLRVSEDEHAWLAARAPSASTPRVTEYGAFEGIGSVARWRARQREAPGRVVGVKLFADGSFGARSAWLERPYADAPETSGAPILTSAALEDALWAVETAELRVAVHALGDRALRSVLDGLEAVRPARRPRIEHVGLVPPGWERRLRAVGPELVVQPGFRRSDAFLAARLGPERLPWAYPLADLARAGFPMAGSSDAPVEPLDPWDGIHSAVRAEGVGQPLGIREAFALYGRGGAAILGANDLGHLEVGAEASFVVWEAADLDVLARSDRVPSRRVFLKGRPVAVDAAA